MPDSPESLISILQTITAISFAAGIVFLLLALIAFRRSRQEAFWRHRRQAGQRGLRYGVLTVISLVMGGAFLLITLTISFVDNRNRTAVVASPTATHTLAALVIATDTPTPMIEISATPTLIPASDVPPSPTQAPTQAVIVPITSSTLNIIAIDDMISDDWRPIQASSSFSTDATRFYFFFSHDGIAEGSIWGQILFRDGEVIRQRSQQWGVTESVGEGFFFFGDTRGFAPGNYEIRLTIGADERAVASARFTVVPQ
jgi:hypothetical protein